MKQRIPYWQVAGFIFVSVLGTFLHFLFDLTNGSMIAAIFSAVNESIWEHMKLLFYPMLLFSLIQHRFWGRKQPGFWCRKLSGILLGLVLIPVLLYTYSGILGKTFDWFNVTIFFIAAGAGYYWEYRLFSRDLVCPVPDWVFVGILVVISLVFTVLTFLPPHIPFFQDPLTGTYGLQ